MAKYQVTRTSNSQYRWVLKASNGETLLTSETYISKQSCFAGIASSKISISDSNFKKLNSVRVEPYFNQVANNNQVLGTSEMYSSSYSRDLAIGSVKKNSPIALVEDLT